MMEKITFKRPEKSEYADFAKETKEIFSIAVEEAFGETLENDNDIESSLNNLDSEVFAGRYRCNFCLYDYIR